MTRLFLRGSKAAQADQEAAQVEAVKVDAQKTEAAGAQARNILPVMMQSEAVL